MSGKQYFCDCCRKMGMDSAALFKIGEQNAQCYGGYVYHCPTRLRGPSHRFVVNYIEEQGLYVAWSLDTPGSEKKTVFRVLKKELEHLSAGEVHAVFKTTHGGDRQKETVRSGGGDAFSSNGARKNDKITQSEHICEEKTFGTIVERTDDRYRAYLRAGDEKRAIRRKKTGLSCHYRGCKRIVA